MVEVNSAQWRSSAHKSAPAWAFYLVKGDSRSQVEELGVALFGQKQLGGIDHGTHSDADPAVFTSSPELLPIPL